MLLPVSIYLGRWPVVTARLRHSERTEPSWSTSTPTRVSVRDVASGIDYQSTLGIVREQTSGREDGNIEMMESNRHPFGGVDLDSINREVVLCGYGVGRKRPQLDGMYKFPEASECITSPSVRHCNPSSTSGCPLAIHPGRLLVGDCRHHVSHPICIAQERQHEPFVRNLYREHSYTLAALIPHFAYKMYPA